MYLRPRCGVLATKESLLRLWCDLGARQPFIRRRATRAGTPTCAGIHRHFALWLRVAGCLPGLRLRLRGSPASKITTASGARVPVSSRLSLLRVDLPEGAHLQLFSLRLLHVARTHRLPDTNAAGCGLGCHYTKTKYPDGLAPSSSLHAGLTYVTYVCDVCDVCNSSFRTSYGYGDELTGSEVDLMMLVRSS